MKNMGSRIEVEYYPDIKQTEIYGIRYGKYLELAKLAETINIM